MAAATVAVAAAAELLLLLQLYLFFYCFSSWLYFQNNICTFTRTAIASAAAPTTVLGLQREGLPPRGQGVEGGARCLH